MSSRWEVAMGPALDEARAALATGDVPIGAVVLYADDAVIGTGRNVREAWPTRPGMRSSWRSGPRRRPRVRGGWTAARWW